MKGGWPVCRGSWSLGVGRSTPKIVLHTSEPRNVSQKHGPSPAVRDAPPAICRPNPNKLDRTSPIAARAPEGFITDRGPRALDQGSGKVAGKVWIVDRGGRSAKLLI